MASTRGLIAVDKKGAGVLFLNSATYETEEALYGFDKTVHELLVVPDTGLAYVPIFGDGIHGRNPNPHHLLCVLDLEKRALLFARRRRDHARTQELAEIDGGQPDAARRAVHQKRLARLKIAAPHKAHIGGQIGE